MTLTEKLKRLIDGKNNAEIARRASVKQSATPGYTRDCPVDKPPPVHEIVVSFDAASGPLAIYRRQYFEPVLEDRFGVYLTHPMRVIVLRDDLPLGLMLVVLIHELLHWLIDLFGGHRTLWLHDEYDRLWEATIEPVMRWIWEEADDA